MRHGLRIRDGVVRGAVALILVGLTGCASSLMPGTRVKDTRQNREIRDVVEAYRVAMEQRNVEALRRMVSMKYFENFSTTDDRDDDYGYDHLIQKVIPKLRDNIKKVQYRIVLRKVVVEGDRASAEYEYYWKFLYTEGGRENWVAANDFNRLDFVREQGAWKIAAGL